MKQIFTSFSTVTPESAEQGDTAESGWYDSGFRFNAMDKPEEGHSCEPDKWDIEDGLNAVDLAVKYLKDKCAWHPSASRFHKNIWYSAESCTEDYSSDESIEYSYHLEGFSEEEQEEIFNARHGGAS